MKPGLGRLRFPASGDRVGVIPGGVGVRHSSRSVRRPGSMVAPPERKAPVAGRVIRVANDAGLRRRRSGRIRRFRSRATPLRMIGAAGTDRRAMADGGGAVRGRRPRRRVGGRRGRPDRVVNRADRAHRRGRNSLFAGSVRVGADIRGGRNAAMAARGGSRKGGLARGRLRKGGDMGRRRRMPAARH